MEIGAGTIVKTVLVYGVGSVVGDYIGRGAALIHNSIASNTPEQEAQITDSYREIFSTAIGVFSAASYFSNKMNDGQ